MTRYIDRTDFENKSLELSFIGMDWEDDKSKVPKTSEVNICLLDRRHVLSDDVPYKEVWRKTEFAVTVPTGIWNGMKLGQLTESKVFVALGRAISELSITTGDTIWTISPGNTPITKIKLTPDKSGLYVLYSYYQFDKKEEKSNLLKFGVKSGCFIIWTAETKTTDDFITDFEHTADGLLAWAWNCFRLKLDDKTGKIMESVFTK